MSVNSRFDLIVARPVEEAVPQTCKMAHPSEHGSPGGMTHVIGIRPAVVSGKIAARYWLLPCRPTRQLHPVGHDLQRIAKRA